ncbi:MAG: hypothetical protein [Bacteriophage sp.]|nr:MAG: hypothetical protein [Bacteriophage sp.]
MLFKNYSRSYDPTASDERNLIINETYPLAALDSQIFIPSFGPFYADTLKVRNGDAVLQRDIDYQCIMLHTDATIASAKEVCVFVKINVSNLIDVSIDYQAVGGQYQNLFPVLKSFVEGLGDKLVSPIRWADIINKPTTFPPAAHLHPYWEFSDWSSLINPLGNIYQGLLFRDRQQYRNTFDYFYTKLAEFENNMDVQIEALSNNIAQTYVAKRKPLNTILLKLADVNPSTYTDGSWQALATGVIGLSNSSLDLGLTHMLSADIVYPQPDNILLNESSNPIMRDDDEWLYLDNNYPVKVGTDPTYWEPIDQQFNALYLRAYNKVADSNTYHATLTSSATSIVEGQSVTFTLQTYHYFTGLSVPYQITGIGTSNLDKPLSGLLKTDVNGQAQLTVQLRPNSTRTDSTTFVLECAIGGGLSAAVNYTLASNTVTSIGIATTSGINDVVPAVVTLGDSFYLRISHHGMAGKTIRIAANFNGNGQHGVLIAGVIALGVNGGYVDYKMPDTTADVYVPIQTLQGSADITTELLINITYASTLYASARVQMQLFEMTPVFIDAFAGNPITTVNSGDEFYVQIKHNSNQLLAFPIAVYRNTFGDEITPSAFETLVYGRIDGYAQSNKYAVQRTTTQIEDDLTLRISSPMLPTVTTDITLTAPAIL